MSDVFISYGRSTAAQAQATAAALRRLGYSVWVDDELPGHREYADVIQEQIDQAKAVVVIWSGEAVKSQWVRSEANRARGHSKLVQFAVDKVSLPMPFDQIQCLNLAGWTGVGEHPGWPKVVASVDALVHGTASPHRPAGRAPATGGERRHLTVLACGLADVASISASVDPEEWHDIHTRFQRQAVAAVKQLDGHVAQSLGDGFVVYFGYPEAREDAAECAVRAGLAVLETVNELNQALGAEHGVRLQVRVGIHAGTVVVAPGDGEQIGMFGDAPRIARAIEAAAEPDTVVISGVVHELVSGLFVVTETDAGRAEGPDATIRTFRAIRPGLASGGARGFAPREVSAFVGRDDELHLLSSRWRRVREGEGQSVLVVGEPGIGKTRLIEEFRNSIRAEPHLWIGAAGAPLFINTPFHAVIRMLDQGLDWRGEDSSDARFERLVEALAPAGLKLAEAAPLIAELLGLPIPPTFAPPMIPPEQKRRRLLAALAGWVFSATTAQPLVIVIEDLQWVDPSTMELVQTLVDQGVTAPLLLIATARPEFRAPWSARGHHAQLSLSRLSDRQTRALVTAMVARGGATTQGEDLVKRIVERTDGVPLFAEELARLMSEGAGHGEGREIPVTLVDSLAARLDRLGRAKETAQLGAVIGRDFTYELISALSEEPEADLEADLAALAEADLIGARGLPPDATYQFKHALIQDVAYDALLKSKRRDLHAKVAHVIVEQFAALAQAQPEVLARHWTEAGEAAPAVAAWKSAGDGAYERRAYKEAEEAYRQALAMVGRKPESPERDAEELALASALNRVLQLTRGYAAPQTLEAAARARALAEKLGAVSELIREEGRIWQALITAADYASAAALAGHILDLIHVDGDRPGRLMFAHLAQVQTSFYTGDLSAVEEHFAVISPMLDSLDMAQAPGNNQISLGVASLAAWISGRAGTARARIDRARAFAEQSKNPYDLGVLLHFSGNLEVFEENPTAAEATASRLLALAEERGMTYLADLARGTLGWAVTRRGAVEEGVALMRRSWAGRVGAAVGLTYGFVRLAEGLALAGKVDEAFAALDEALNFNPQERVFQPAAIVHRGDLRLQNGDADGAEADFRQAISMAQEMGAGTWGLRAALSLAGLLRDRGDGEAAGAMVERVLKSLPEPPCAADQAKVEAFRAGAG